MVHELRRRVLEYNYSIIQPYLSRIYFSRYSSSNQYTKPPKNAGQPTARSDRQDTTLLNGYTYSLPPFLLKSRFLSLMLLKCQIPCSLSRSKRSISA